VGADTVVSVGRRWPWDFRVWGEVEEPVTLAWEAFAALPATENVQDIHCVTRWSRFDARKSAKWLRGIELTAADRPGFWERYGYHNDADPFEEQRYGL
jgi:DMSO/TMAO reductase YedYZ molybdopterin-dependent catalytic subunit